MAYSFNEIMAYHPDNADVYREIKQLLPRLIPFIGAGLTQFAYCSWPGALKTLSSKLTNSMNAQKVTNLINSKYYLDAAQLLEDFRTPVNLARDLAGIFSANKLEQKRGQLPKEPISLLPYLFPDLVLTTNFDETLETIYREGGHPFQTVFLPGHSELLRQLMRQGGVRGLFKLHGTVTGGLIEYEKIVFTQTQYDLHYGKDSPLTRELKACFENRMVLFLGCSLDNDRTMELLQEVIHPGDSYYAVISCDSSERDEKIRQLGKKHIRAILYEKDRHEAVRMILEHLLEETDPESYSALPTHIGALKSIDLSERFSYKAEIVPFTGRADELQALNSFLSDAHIAFRWWAITGPGGSGKSRLAYEFQKQLPPDWTVHYLNSDDYVDLSLLTIKLTQKTLLIADYVQENAKAIGKWMEQINEKNRSLPIRVLLVERESGTNEADAGWAKQLYADVRHEQKLKNSCYRGIFLVLKPLEDDNLLSIIGSYALAINRDSGHIERVLPDAVKQHLLQTLKSIDPILYRPLYALFLTDAYVTGQNPEHWNRNDILDYITIREQKRLNFNIRHTLRKSDEKLYAACLHLYSVATVLQNASLEELQMLCPNTWDIIQRKADSFVSPADMLEQASLAERGTVFALRPDLIGEYFVYTWLLRHSEEAQQFLYTVWLRPARANVFFNRMFHDYSYVLNENAKHWELILPNNIPTSENTTWFYEMLLVNAIHYCSIIEECQRQINLLEMLVFAHPMNLDIAIVLFAKGLVNLSAKQDTLGAQDTIARLERLAVEHQNVLDITVLLAQGLCNLSAEQDVLGAQNTIARLECLVAQHPDEPDIAIELAKGLVNLSIDQDEQGKQDIIERLDRLVSEYPEVLDFSILLTKGLFNLSVDQEEHSAQSTIKRLERIVAEHPDVPDIAVEYAKALVNLSAMQDVLGAMDTIAHLEHLAVEYPDVPDIAVALAKGLVNLSNKQDIQCAIDTIVHLGRLAVEYPDVPDIAVMLTLGLVNLSDGLDVSGVQNIIARLECLAAEHPDVPDIIIELAKGLFNLSAE